MFKFQIQHSSIKTSINIFWNFRTLCSVPTQAHKTRRKIIFIRRELHTTSLSRCTMGNSWFQVCPGHFCPTKPRQFFNWFWIRHVKQDVTHFFCRPGSLGPPGHVLRTKLLWRQRKLKTHSGTGHCQTCKVSCSYQTFYWVLCKQKFRCSKH